MKLKLSFLIALMLITSNKSLAQSEMVEGRRLYSIGILEMDESRMRDFNEKYTYLSEQNRDGSKRSAFASALIAANRSAFVSKVASTTEGLLDVTLSHLGKGMENPRKRWEETVKSECRFSKSLGMVEEVKDFYAKPSTRGALDAANILFDGFNCRQDIKIGKDTVNVFYISCKLDTSKIERMISHSKFEVYVDSVRFNPYLCDIPNDSLNDISKRIAFDFNKREDLRLKIHASISSSWMNEAVMIFEDQKLGEFDIEVQIDSNVVLNNPEHVYTYKAGADSSRSQQISVRGESFVVPRSYSGNDEDEHSLWGTGQYKIDMTVSESCRINMSYYHKDIAGTQCRSEKAYGKAKWNKNWVPEWKLISKRPKKESIWNEWGSVITTKWTGKEWLTEITSPTTSFLIKEGSNFLNGSAPAAKNNAVAATSQSPGGNDVKTNPKKP